MEHVFAPSFLYGFACILPAAIWIFSLVGWMIQDEIGPLEGWISIGVVLGLVVMAFTSKNETFSLISATSLWLGGAIYPFVKIAHTNRENLKIDVELMQAAYSQLDQKNNNVGAKVQLAKLLYKRGAYAHAIHLLTEATSAAPELLDEERRTLRMWESLHGKVAESRQIRCPKCSKLTPGTERYCRGCTGPVLIYAAGGLNVMSTAPMKMFYIWAAAVSIIVLVPGLAMTLPAGVAIGCILAVVAVALILILRASKNAIGDG
ncbi:MAG: hypothetical protein U0R49_05150 [Fimbriimonadales bacterium]